METMLALVKKEARPGLWLDKVPVPRIGINDVLIKVRPQRSALQPARMP